MTATVLLAAACVASNLSCATAPADGALPAGRAEPRTLAAKACDRLGPGYVSMPGSDTCLKVGGSVRVDGALNLGR
jgi:hypothetical protein